MTGCAAHSAKIATLVAAFDADVATLAVSADIGVNRCPRFLLELVHIGFRHLLKFGWEIVRVLFNQGLGVILVLLCTEYRFGPIGIVNIVIAERLFVAGAGRSPSPEGALNFSGFGLHD